MRVFVVTETTEHDTHDYTDGTEVVGVYKTRAGALNIIDHHFCDEAEGRGLDTDEASGNWTDHNGGYLRDEQDACTLSWAIEPYEVW
jgi:hypothetical protein